MPGTPRFRLQAKHLFLTYPRYEPSTLEEVRDILTERLSAYCVQRYIVAKELHKDGTKHVHVYLQLERRCSIPTPTFLDINEHHGNYQSCRSPCKVKAYCTKNTEWISDFYVKKKTYGDVLGSQTEEDFRETIREVDPRSVVLFERNVESFINNKFRGEPCWSPEFPIEQFRNYGPIADRIQECTAITTGRGLSTVIESPSGYGKTELVRTLLHSRAISSIYVSGMYNADAFPKSLSEIRFIIFDDVDLEPFFKFCWKSYFGCQREFSITDKYKSKRKLYFPHPWSFIWLCNADNNPLINQGWKVPDEALTYLKDRDTKLITLFNKLY